MREPSRLLYSRKFFCIQIQLALVTAGGDSGTAASEPALTAQGRLGEAQRTARIEAIEMEV